MKRPSGVQVAVLVAMALAVWCGEDFEAKALLTAVTGFLAWVMGTHRGLEF
jgi:hypothetical protein